MTAISARISGVTERVQRPMTPHQHTADWSGPAMAITHSSKPGPKRRPIAVRFWECVTVTEGCWLWTGCQAGKGYGMLHWARGSKGVYAHRLSWEIANGRPVPDGLFVLHSCDTPLCVRPDHLRVGTAKENAADAKDRNRLAARENTRHYGEANGRAKVSNTQIVEIRRRYSEAPRGQRIRRGELARLAADFDLTPRMILFIVQRKNWKEV